MAKKAVKAKRSEFFIMVDKDPSPASWECCCGKSYPTFAAALKEAQGHVDDDTDIVGVKIAEVVMTGEPAGFEWTKS